jgi:hypothetical protein
MKKYPLIFFVLILILSVKLFSQTVTVYSQNFNAGFGSWTNTNLASPGGIQ